MSYSQVTLALRLYAAAHQCGIDTIEPTDPGYYAITQILSEHAATTPEFVPPPRRLLCAFCVRTAIEGDTVHEAMTIISGNAVCQEHTNDCPEDQAFKDVIESIERHKWEERRARGF